MNIPKDVEFILNKINQNDFEAFIVGGCVRDNLLNKIPNDYDITTNANPSDIIEIFKDYKLILNGVKHGTVGIIINNEVYEITTYRIEKEYLDNRRPSEVIFSNDIKEDLKRRDFTINSMAYNFDKGLIDLFGGKNDLDKKIIKTVGNADERFKEDALRMVRAIRFSSKLNFNIEKETLGSIYKNSYLIKNISIERITDEFNKILDSNYPEKLILLFETKILKNTGINYNIEDYETFSKNLSKIKYFEKDIEKLILLRYILDDFSLIEKLTYNNNIKQKVKKSIEIIKLLNQLEILNEEQQKINLKLILKEFGYELLYETLNTIDKYYNYLDKKNNYNIYLELLSNIKINNECYSLSQLKLNGKDLVILGYNGKDIGDTLNKLLDIVIENNDLNDKNLLINFLKNR